MKDECRMLKDEGGVEDERTDRWMDICDYRVAFVTEMDVILWSQYLDTL